MQTLRVATLNIWNRSGPWERRLELIRTELRRLEPDVVGLQEVLRYAPGTNGEACSEPVERLTGESERDQAAAIAAGFGYHLAYAPALDLGEGLFFGNAVLSRWPILEQRTHPLPSERSGEQRCLLYAGVQHPEAKLPVFVTHLNWKLHHGSVRRAQVRFITDKVFALAPLAEAALPPILMGDFNAEPDSDEIRYLRGLATIDDKSVYFADVWIYAGEGPGHTFDRRNSFAALAHEPPRRIDYIFVRGPDRQLRGEPVKASLAFDTVSSEDGRDVWPSDHFGVVADLVMSPRPVR